MPRVRHMDRAAAQRRAAGHRSGPQSRRGARRRSGAAVGMPLWCPRDVCRRRDGGDRRQRQADEGGDQARALRRPRLRPRTDPRRLRLGAAAARRCHGPGPPQTQDRSHRPRRDRFGRPSRFRRHRRAARVVGDTGLVCQPSSPPALAGVADRPLGRPSRCEARHKRCPLGTWRRLARLRRRRPKDQRQCRECGA